MCNQLFAHSAAATDLHPYERCVMLLLVEDELSFLAVNRCTSIVETNRFSYNVARLEMCSYRPDVVLQLLHSPGASR